MIVTKLYAITTALGGLGVFFFGGLNQDQVGGLVLLALANVLLLLVRLCEEGKP